MEEKDRLYILDMCKNIRDTISSYDYDIDSPEDIIVWLINSIELTL